MLIALFLFLIPLHFVLSQQTPCYDFAVSDCYKDQNAELLAVNADSQLNCQEFCKITGGCLFYAYYESPPIQSVNCHLFKEPFNLYLDHCDVLSGSVSANPPAKCLDPFENSCEVEQFEDCVLYGTVLERNVPAPDVTICEEFCRINQEAGCKYWQWNRERETCDIFDSADKVCNIKFGPKNFAPGECRSTGK